jgi:uncharacterized membrane protein YjjB (DUF3815 family)
MSEAGSLIPSAPATGAVGNTRSIPLSILWAILTLGIYTFFWVYRTQEELRNYSGQGLGGPLGLVVYLGSMLVGYVFVIVTGVLIAGELQRLYEREGREPPCTALWGLWLLLPIVGHFVWFIRVQGGLNEFWQSKGAPAP